MRLDPALTVYETLAAGSPNDMVPAIRNILGGFLFSGDDVYKKVRVLSGGERTRLAVARMLLRPANTLLLDEPTEGLAPVIVQRIGEIIRQIKAQGVAVLLVEQNVKFASTVADRHYLLAQGKVVESLDNESFQGRTGELLEYLGM